MSSNPLNPSALISVSRIRTLVASIFVSLGSGTNYVSNVSIDYFQCRYESKKMLLGLFRWGTPSFVLTAFKFSEGERDQENDLLTIFFCVAYSPQLGTRLKISHTQLNIVALAANGADFRAF